MEKSVPERETIELIAYMLTSARNLMDEPALYGPFRLMDGVSRLCDLLADTGHTDAEFLSTLKKKIDEGKFSVMTDVDSFVALMDETVLDITHLLMANPKP
jgi:uncharacterized protein DUF6092